MDRAPRPRPRPMTRTPRARRNGEDVVTKRAVQLSDDDLGCIVQHPGNRGWLQGVSPTQGGMWVCTTTGVAIYPFDAEFLVWGRDEQRTVLDRFKREATAR